MGSRCPPGSSASTSKGTAPAPATQSAFLATVSADDDVILFSHGWRTQFFGAVDLYQRFLLALEAVRRAQRRRDRSFVFVGVTWPSDWHFFREGPRMAADGPGEEDTQIADAIEEMATSLAPPPGRKALRARFAGVCERDGG
jgi:hypothetical protein